MKRARLSREQVIATASPAVRALNPGVFREPPPALSMPTRAKVESAPLAQALNPGKRGPNKTEQLYADTFLALFKARGQILDYAYEALRLRIGEPGARCWYVIDWTVFEADGRVGLVEVKGGHVWEDARVKFEAARRIYPAFDWTWARKVGRGWEIDEYPGRRAA